MGIQTVGCDDIIDCIGFDLCWCFEIIAYFTSELPIKHVIPCPWFAMHLKTHRALYLGVMQFSLLSLMEWFQLKETERVNLKVSAQHLQWNADGSFVLVTCQ